MKPATITNFAGDAGMTLESGTVHAVNGDTLLVQNAGGVFAATRAFGCLVEPREGDTVMLARDSAARCHVLAVLTRPDAQDAAIRMPGKLDVHAQGIGLSTPGDISAVASRVAINTVQADVHAVAASLRGETAEVSYRRIRTISDRIETIADHCTQRLKVSIRWIAELEDVNAGQLVQKVRGLFASRSRQALITADDDVKVDGKRIHMG